jgi:hypothetical protein
MVNGQGAGDAISCVIVLDGFALMNWPTIMGWVEAYLKMTHLWRI